MQTSVYLFCALTTIFGNLWFSRPIKASLKENTCFSMPTATTSCDKRIVRGETKAIVWTKQGWIQGRKVKDKDTGFQYDEYLGIRYVRTPPRFQRAEYPPFSWWGVFPADTYPSQCPWIYNSHWLNTNLSEDCLFLNVYVPRGKELTKHRLPVLVSIHPGGFEMGNAHSFNHRAWTSRGIIVVSIAYRLGVFGWATSGNSLLPGNLGLWDQHAALKWTNDNMFFFNGDINRITISGFSAGATSGIAHLLSPKSRGLFKRVMAVSGSALGYYASKIPCDKHKEYGRWIHNFARSLNCSGHSVKETINCLQNVSMMDLLTVSNIAKNMDYHAVDDRWGPVIDGDFIPAPPKTLYRHLGYRQIDLMVGSGYHDARVYVGSDYEEPRPNINTPADYYKWRYNSTYHLGDLVRTEAFRNYGLSPNTDPNSEAYTLLMTHETYGVPQELDATLHARYTRGRTYNFVWRHRPSFSSFEDWVEGDHWFCLNFWLGRVSENWSYFNPTDAEWRHEQDLLDYQANFIENGDPNRGRPVAKFWPQYKDAMLSRNVLEFRVPTEKSKVIDNYWGNKVQFWADVWDKSYGDEDHVCSCDQNRGC